MKNEQKFYGWKLVGILFIAYLFNMGFPLYAGAVINTYMLKEIVMDRTTYGMGFTLINLFTGGMSIVVAYAIAKWEIRKTMLFGCTINIIGALWMAFGATQPWHYLLGFGVLMGIGGCFSCIVPSTTLCVRWFIQFRGRAIAIVLTASALGGFIGAPVINKILTANGGDWRQAWMLIGVICIVGMALVYLFVKERPEDIGQLPDGGLTVTPPKSASGQSLHTTYDWTPAEVYRTRTFWLIFIGVISCKVPFFFFMAHGLLHAKGIGISVADAALAMGLFSLGGIPGRLIGGWLMDKIPARFVFGMGLCCYIIGCILEINLTKTTVVMTYAGAAFIGAGFGWTFVVVNTLPGHYFGPKAFAKVNGMFITLASVFSSQIGVIGGILYDKFNSYSVAFELCIVVCIVGIIALLFAPVPQAPVRKLQEARGECV